MRGLALVLITGLGCGPSGGLWLRIEAPLLVPAECNALDVSVWRGAAQGAPLFQRHYSLNGKHQFPMTLALTTSDSANLDSADGMTTSATATLNDTEVAAGSGATTLERGKLTEIDLLLQRSP